MRIALVSSSFHPYPGGVEEHTRNVAHALTRLGHAVEVWTVDRGEHLGVRTHEGIVVRYLPTPLPARKLGPGLRFMTHAPGAWLKWVAARRAFRPDILNVQCFGPNALYAVALNRASRVPLVVSTHGETFMDDHHVFETSALMRRALRAVPQFASRVTSCSEFAAGDLTRRFGLPEAVVVPNGVDLDEAAQCDDVNPPFDPAVPTIVAIGRIQHVKGFDLLLRAFAQADLDPSTHLFIGGDGDTLEELRLLASELGVQDRVHLPGRLDRCQVTQAMAHAAVIVVPSRVEAFGIVVLEAWRSERPLIATTRGGPASIVTDGVDGLLVDPEDTAALGSALERVMSDRALASGLAAGGRGSVLRYTWDRVARDYLDLYSFALTHNRRTNR